MSRSERHRRADREPEGQYRASFPEEAVRPPMMQRSDEDYTAYPDQAYHPAYFEEQEPNAFPPADAYFPPAEPQPAYGGTRRGDRSSARNTSLWVCILLCSLCALSLMGYYVYSRYSAYRPFREMVAVTQQKTFAQGILVDGVHIGGMTMDQARQALSQTNTGSENELRMQIHVGGETWVLTRNELPFFRNTDAVLETAYAIGRQGSVETLGSSMTPLEYRYAHLYHTVSNAAYLYTRVTYDPEKVRELVGIIESNINRDPVNAMVESFDFSTRSFSFSADVPGRAMDGQALYDRVISALDSGDYTASISVDAWEIAPQVTRTELMNTFAMVSTYTTQTTDSANRNNNIDLAARAVNGTVVMPGETFSFNAATGERTTAKGYLPAAAIAGGATVDEVGGGVCQVSSTLFNAAAMANLTILNRSPHTWPSTYVDKGRDATVNWPNLDFSFRNDGSAPIFIACWYQNRQVTVELYGVTLGPGLSIDLETRVVSVTEPPAEALYEQNPALESGTVQEKKKARTGYEVETYKVYKQNGVEYDRELLCNSTYKMIQQVIEYN